MQTVSVIQYFQWWYCWVFNSLVESPIDALVLHWSAENRFFLNINKYYVISTILIYNNGQQAFQRVQQRIWMRATFLTRQAHKNIMNMKTQAALCFVNLPLEMRFSIISANILYCWLVYTWRLFCCLESVSKLSSYQLKRNAVRFPEFGFKFGLRGTVFDIFNLRIQSDALRNRINYKGLQYQEMHIKAF